MFIMFGLGLGFPWFFAVLLVLVGLLRWVAFGPAAFDPLGPVSVAKCDRKATWNILPKPQVGRAWQDRYFRFFRYHQNRLQSPRTFGLRSD